MATAGKKGERSRSSSRGGSAVVRRKTPGKTIEAGKKNQKKTSKAGPNGDDLDRSFYERHKALMLGALLSVVLFGNTLMQSLSSGGSREGLPYDTRTLWFSVEIFKFTLTAATLFSQGFAKAKEELSHISLTSMGTFVALATLYTVSNNLGTTSYGYLDPSLIVIVSQLKVVGVALMMKVAFAKRLALSQWFGLVICVSGASIAISFKSHEANSGGGGGGDDDAAATASRGDVLSFTYGLTVLILAISSSCAAAVLSEFVAKVSLADQSTTLQNLQMYSIGIVTNIASLVRSGKSIGPSMFEGFNAPAVVVLVLFSAQGLITSFTLRHGSAMVKTLAVPCSLILVSIYSNALSFSESSMAKLVIEFFSAFCMALGVLQYSVPTDIITSKF